MPRFRESTACCGGTRTDRFQIKDLDSRNGTLVNGVAIKEQWLRHGDEIATGDSVFLFLLEEEEQRGSRLAASSSMTAGPRLRPK